MRVAGQLLLDGGLYYLIAPEGVFHVLSTHLNKTDVEGDWKTFNCEVIPGYGKVDRRTLD